MLHTMRLFGKLDNNTELTNAVTDALPQEERARNTWLVPTACQCTYHAEERASVMSP